MNISRRHLTGPLPVLGLVAVGLLGAKAAQALTADEEAVAKRLEAFRSAQVRRRREGVRRALRGGTELQPLRRPRRGQGDVHQERHRRKIEVPVAGIRGPLDPRGRRCRDRAVPLGGRERNDPRWQEKLHQSPHPDELAKTGRRLETAVPRVHQALTVATWMARLARPSRRLVTRSATAPACTASPRHHAVRTPPRPPRRS